MAGDASREATSALFVIGGYNGLQSVRTWVNQLSRNSNAYAARGYSWRDARSAGRDIASLQQGKQQVILIGFSLGGGHAELLLQQLPKGSVNKLVTVSAFGPPTIDHRLTRENVGYWLNIVSMPDRRGWRDIAREIMSPTLLGWHEHGFIPDASENHVCRLPHHDFYKMMSERCGAVEHGKFKL